MKDISFIASILCISTAVKILLFPCYTSTDFEVHRNWLAITYSLPYQQWYFDKTSEWTLDYPPFFAWFERILSQIAVHIDADMVNMKNLNYKSNATLYFQRISVIVTELLLVFAGYKCAKSLWSSTQHQESRKKFFILLTFNCGLFIVDHIHFQYNGFLFGILFLSFASLIEGNILWSAFWFAVLLNFKHIFLYIAPAYAVFFIRTYCMDRLKKWSKALFSFQITKLFALAAVVLVVFSVSFGPFVNDIEQVLSRLFPFKRGLTHAYWAPNFWALYNAADKVLAVVGKRVGWVAQNVSSSSSSGLVQFVEHSVLPSIPPLLTFLLTFLSMIPCLFNIFFKPKSSHIESVCQFLRAVVICSLCSFMFGWHVHEKAILMAILPFTLLALCGSPKDAQIFLFLQAVGHYSLFPLLYTSFETPIKFCLLLLYSIFAFSTFSKNTESSSKFFPCLSIFESLYLCGIILLEVFCTVIFPLTHFAKQFAFLPLMLTSTYCAVGVTWSWLSLYFHCLSSETVLSNKKNYKEQ